MSIFISFNYSTGFCAAMALAEELRRVGDDPWWFPEPLSPEQLDDIVDTALSNCRKCIIIWSKANPSEWQIAEIALIRQYLARRAPAGDPTDMFLVFRNTADPEIVKKETMPFLSNCEYIDYYDERGSNSLAFKDMCRASNSTDKIALCKQCEPDTCKASDFAIPPLDHIAGYTPGIEALTYSPSQKPRFSNRKLEPGKGKYVLAGEFIKVEQSRERDVKYCWIFLKDKYGNYYLQQPRPTITHKRRWLSGNIHLGPEIESIVLAALGTNAHQTMVNKVLKKEWGGIEQRTLPDDFLELDRITFDPT